VSRLFSREVAVYGSGAMKSLLRRATAISSLFLLIACGNQKPAKSVGGQNGDGTSPNGQGGATPNLDPAAAPPDLVVKGRLSDPGAVVDTVMEWAKLPFDWRRMAQQNEPEAMNVVALSAPLEFAVALDKRAPRDNPQPFAVFSFGVNSVEAAASFIRRQGRDVRREAGTYRMSAEGMSCAIAPSVGKSRARVVCGDRDADVDALLPYATRGLPNEQMGSASFHAEFVAEPIRRVYGNDLRMLKAAVTPYVMKEASIDNPRFDRALGDAVHGLADELMFLVDDIDRVSIDAQFRKDQGLLDVTGAMKFRSSTSWVAAAVATAGKNAKGPPEEFWRLPEDAQSANFVSGSDPKLFAKARSTLSELADGFLEHGKVPKTVRDQVNEIIKGMFAHGGSYTSAHGQVPPTPNANPFDAREMLRTQLGWYVGSLGEKMATYKTYFDKIAKLYADPQLRKLLAQNGIKPQQLPRLVARGSRAGLPAGSVVYELTIPGEFFGGSGPMMAPVPPGKRAAPPAKLPPLVLVLALAPDGDRTWYGISSDERLVSTKMANALKKQNTIENRRDLRSLKSDKTASGGYFTAMSLVAALMQRAGGLRAAQRTASALPHKGETAMTFSSAVGAGPSVTWQMSVPSAVFEDLGTAAMSLSSGSTGSSPQPMAPMPPPPPPPRAPKKRP
jgi:hypothetical protein